MLILNDCTCLQFAEYSHTDQSRSTPLLRRLCHCSDCQLLACRAGPYDGAGRTAVQRLYAVVGGSSQAVLRARTPCYYASSQQSSAMADCTKWLIPTQSQLPGMGHPSSSLNSSSTLSAANQLAHVAAEATPCMQWKGPLASVAQSALIYGH